MHLGDRLASHAYPSTSSTYSSLHLPAHLDGDDAYSESSGWQSTAGSASITVDSLPLMTHPSRRAISSETMPGAARALNPEAAPFTADCLPSMNSTRTELRQAGGCARHSWPLGAKSPEPRLAFFKSEESDVIEEPQPVRYRVPEALMPTDRARMRRLSKKAMQRNAWGIVKAIEADRSKLLPQ